MNSAERREYRRTMKFGPKKEITSFFNKEGAPWVRLSCGHEVPEPAPRRDIDVNPFVRCGLCPKPATC